MKESPLVSVVITTYNRAKLLERAIDSVLEQTYPNIEIIITDDNSTDTTRELVEAYMRKCRTPILYRSNDKNMGACFTRNEGIKIASGYFYTGLDDDDSFEKDRIENFINNWADSYGFLSSNIKVIGKKSSYNLFFCEELINNDKLYWYNFVGNQIFTIRERIMKIGGFDNELPSTQDLDLWVRMIREYGPGFRLKHSSYNLFIDHDLPRITTSTKKVLGLNVFFTKHSQYMTRTQKKSYLFKTLYWKNNKKLSLASLKYLSINFCYFYSYILLLKLYRYINKVN